MPKRSPSATKGRWSGSKCSTPWKPSMKRTLPGEIWRVDFGMAAKVRPALVLSDYPRDEELALLVVIPHTTAVRGNRWELALPKPFLKPGVFHLQQIQPISLARFDARGLKGGTLDGLHLSQQGHDALANSIYRLLKTN